MAAVITETLMIFLLLEVVNYSSCLSLRMGKYRLRPVLLFRQPQTQTQPQPEYSEEEPYNFYPEPLYPESSYPEYDYTAGRDDYDAFSQLYKKEASFIPNVQQNGADVYLRPNVQQNGADVYLRPNVQQNGADAYLRPNVQQNGADVYLRPNAQQNGADVYLRPNVQQNDADVYLRPNVQQNGADAYLRPVSTEIPATTLGAYETSESPSPTPVVHRFNRGQKEYPMLRPPTESRRSIPDDNSETYGVIKNFESTRINPAGKNLADMLSAELERLKPHAH